MINALAPGGTTDRDVRNAWPHIPRTARGALEDAGPTVIDIPRVDPEDDESDLLDEFVITTTLENAEMQIYRDARPLV